MTDTGTISQAQKDYAKFIAAQRKECASTFASDRKQFRTGREAIGALGEIVFADHYLLEHPGVTLLGSAEHNALCQQQLRVFILRIHVRKRARC